MVDSTNPSGINKNLAVNLLPNIFRTDPNKRFLQATIDQLIKPGVVKKVNGYIGRQNAKSVSGKDIFIKASDNPRQNYQLEPGLVIEDTLGNNTFFKDYIDYINQLKVFGANVKNHARINKQEFYSWDPHIDWDKFVNFQNYYWLPYGPETIRVYGQRNTSSISTYKVELQKELTNTQYLFTPDGLTPNPAIRLYRGQTYNFEINSPGNPFSIKVARTLSILDKFNQGVTNNSIETGTLTFTVPVDAPSLLYYQSDTDINTGGVIEIFSITEDSFIDVEKEIIGKKNYKLSNGMPLSNGMKLSFGGTVTPSQYASGEYYVEGVGIAIKLVNKLILEVVSTYTSSDTLKFDSVPFDTDAFGDLTGYAKNPDYILINRASKDRNPWSRYNRWFHKNVIESSAEYNGNIASLDQVQRAVRPIIEFEPDLKLFNFGTTATSDIDLVDTYTTDVFSTIEGTLGYNVDGIDLAQGQKILFLADTDRLVKNNLYQVEFIDVTHTSISGIPSRQIHLVKIAEPNLNDVVLVKAGKESQGFMYWYNGTTWIKSQQKSNLNQAPLFDICDANGISYGNANEYEGTTFAGTSLFTYKIGSGIVDSNLGFSLSYKNINNIGDIVFNFTLMTDTFQYKKIINVISEKVNKGFLSKLNYDGTTSYVNGWQLNTAKNIQAGIRIYKDSGKVNNFDIDIFDEIAELSDLAVKIYINGKFIPKTNYKITDAVNYKRIIFNTDVDLLDVITIKTYSAQPINNNGYYEIPINLQNNPLNGEISDFTLGEVLDHVESIVENLNEFNGAFPGASNIRDLGNITQYGTKFVQHSGPASLSLYHITSNINNIIRSIEQSRDYYNQFKKNFISYAESIALSGTIADQVNTILESLNKDKQTSSPYYFSDMVPYKGATVSKITVIDPRVKTYPLITAFNLDSISSKAVGIYVNENQLIYEKDYTFNSQGFIYITATIQENDIITIREYSSTDGNFVPETPTKLGLWPKYEPKIYLDTTLRTPRLMIQGHDGSETLAYEDFRDDLLLELEKRIFNNIKVQYDTEIFDLADVIPTYNNPTDYLLSEFNDILAPSFYKWATILGQDFTKMIGYDQYDSFTYNYAGYTLFDGTPCSGYWRGVYNYVLGTYKPNITPWEMLGFSIKPNWWEDLYGPAPYTSDNIIMWKDIAEGIVREPGKPFVKKSKYVRPYLLNHLPVDGDGNLLSPIKSGIIKGVITEQVQADFVFGDQNPVESAWRRSSNYSFSVILASALMTPAKVFGTLLDRSRIIRNVTGQLVYKDTGVHIKPSDVVIPSIYSSLERIQTSGIINYISNYILSDNLKSYDQYRYELANIKTKLSYRLGAFTSKEKFNLLLDSKTPHSTGSVFVPPENYNIILNSSSPIKKITYSGVIITKSYGAYEVRGYSKTSPFFTYYPYQKSGKTINVGGISESYVLWTAEQFFAAGKVVKNQNKFYRTTVSHTSTTEFDASKFVFLGDLPMIGGCEAIFRTQWDRESPLVIPYGYKFYTIQETVDFLVGYGEWLKDEGFIFDEFNNNLNAITNWETSAKEFMFWTTQNWSAGQDKWREWSSNEVIDFETIVRYNGQYYKAIKNIEINTPFNLEDYVLLDGLSSVGSSVISLSPSADKIVFKTPLSVVDDIKNPFNGYELFKVDGTPLEAIFINSYREDNAVSYSPRTIDGIYGASFFLIQNEHVILIDNTTMFNDTVYNPETGYKQDRIKVSGYISTDWYGGLDIPGFILDVAKIQNWTPWTDYDLGDIVKYKQFFYTASKFLPGAELFDSTVWIRLNKQPKTELLPNWSYKAAQFEDFYSLDSDNFDQGQQKLAQHLVGYQKRQYLENIIQDDVSEFKFYQGMIAEKGTQNVLNKLFDVLSADGKESLDFYEEWALRVGQYGASSAFENIEFILDENLFRSNPQGFELTNNYGTVSNFIIQQGPSDVYLKPIGYNNNPWPKLEFYKSFLRSSGYARPSEVFVSLSKLEDIVNEDISTFKNGAYISVAFEETSWNIYRFTTTDYIVKSSSFDKNSKTFSLEFNKLSKIKANSYVGIYGSALINGFYQVTSSELNKIVLPGNFKSWPTQIAKPEDLRIFVLVSQRTDSINSLDSVLDYNLKENEQLWTDDIGTGQWGTWIYKPVYDITRLPNSSPSDSLDYGKVLATNKLGTILGIGTSNGEIETWDKAGYTSPWIQRQTIQKPYIEPNNINLSRNLATVLAISSTGKWLATGSPLASHVYTKFKEQHNPGQTYSVGEIVVSDSTYYIALINTTIGTQITNTSAWRSINYIPVDTSGQDSGKIHQGVISLYEKDVNNIYTLIDTIVSPTPAQGENFGSSLVFADDSLYVSASGFNNVGKVYKLSYTTTVHVTASYNPVGSSGTTLRLSSTVGIRVNMYVQGIGFSDQYVVEIIDSTRILLSNAPDTDPGSILKFVTTGWGYVMTESYVGTHIGSIFGSNLATSSNGSVLAISEQGNDINGRVYVVTEPGNLGSPIVGTTPGFGQSVSISDNAEYLAISDNLLDEGKIDSGSVSIYKNLFGTFVFQQKLFNHKIEQSGFFGSKISFMNNYKTIAVYSSYEDSSVYTTVDNNTTVFDNETTKFLTNKVDSGRVDIYDLYANKWVYSETLEVPVAPIIANPTNDPAIEKINDFIKSNKDGYGTGFAVGGNHVIIGAPYTVDNGLMSGKVYDYLKPLNSYSWSILHKETEKPDVSRIKKAFLYNRKTGELVKYLDVIDPAQGKFAGPAEEELRYKSFYDPATYSIGTSDVNVDEYNAWSKEPVGRLWWDLRTTKFINSYDDDIVYRNGSWNILATGSTVDIYEWVESTLLPDAWDKQADTEAGLAAGISGTSLYGNAIYSIRQRYDTISQTFKNTYYFWVKNKKTVPNIPGRYISAQTVSDLISNPRGQGYSYLSLTGLNSFSLTNVSQYLKDTDVVLSVEYWTIDKTDQNIHSEWKIINAESGTDIPASIELKWIDSLCGKDSFGRSLPDFSLPPKLRYGVENKPRQSMFVNRFEALKQFIEQTNIILSQEQLVENKNIGKLEDYDKPPSTITGLYDTTQDTELELRFVNIGAWKRPIFGAPVIEDGRIKDITIEYPGRGYVIAPYLDVTGSGVGAKIRTTINIIGQITGVEILYSGEGYDDNTVITVRDYSVLVYNDSEANGNWSIYSYDVDTAVWSRVKAQAYDVRKYWYYIDWYATGYNQFTAVDFVIDTLSELNDLSVSVGQIIKVKNYSNNSWLLLEKYSNIVSIDYTETYKTIGIGNGTINLKSSLYKSIGTDTGYDSSIYDGTVYDNAPAIELRIILDVLKNEILINSLKPKYLELFFTTVRYALSEQVYIDWIYKTSFVKSKHNVGSLNQPATYLPDNLSNFQDYINEVKPFRTKIREYVSSYDSLDTSNLLTTDFDLPPVLRNNKIIPINTNINHGSLTVYSSLINEQPWKSWYDNVGFEVIELRIIDGGSGYIIEPTVKIQSDSGSGATARAFYSNGIINRVILLTKGSGYLSAPTVIINGGLDVGGTPAKVVAIIGNSLVRSTRMNIKFDRLTYSNYVVNLQETEIFQPQFNTSGKSTKIQFLLKYAPDIRINTSSVTVGGILALRDTYSLSIITSKTKGYTTYTGLLTFNEAPQKEVKITYNKDISILNAADRITYFYDPISGELGKDLSQLMTGIDYGGVSVIGLGLDISSGWGSVPYFTDKWDSFDPKFDDYITTVGNVIAPFTLPYIPDAGTELNFYHVITNTESYTSDGVILKYNFSVYDYIEKVLSYRVVPSGAVASNYVLVGSSGTTLKVANTTGITSGMYVLGQGFNSNQKVVTVLNSTTLIISAEPNTLPNGTLEFTKSIAGSKIISLISTVGLSPGDKVSSEDVSAFGYETIIKRIINSTEIELNQIIYETIPVGVNIVFTKELTNNLDYNILTGGVLTLTSALPAGTDLRIYSYFDPIRIDDGSIIADGITQTFTIPPGYTNPINSGDTIIIRKSTSDGSVAPQEADYDTSLSGGAFEGNYLNGTFTSATGYAADDIILDGDGFVTPTSSPAPEELVPGQLVDAVSIKVFDRPYNSSASIKVDNFILDGLKTSYTITQRPNSSTALIVKIGNTILENEIDYTFDYKTLVVNLNNPGNNKDILSIYSVGFNGESILDLDYFVGDGTTKEFVTRAKWFKDFTSIIYQDGVIIYPELFETDSSYESSNRIAMRFGIAPQEGSLINFIITKGSIQKFGITQTEKLATNGSSTYPLSFSVGDILPYESNMIVRANNRILNAPINTYFEIKNNRLNYTVDATRVTPYSVPITNVFVFVGNTQLSLGTDYTVDPGGLTVKINKIIYSTYYKQTLTVSVNDQAEYIIDKDLSTITFTNSYTSNDLVEVISSYKNNYIDDQRTEITISKNLSFTTDTIEFFNYKGLTAGTIPLDRSVMDSSYVWLIKNGTLLTPNVDYILLPSRDYIELAMAPEIDDKFQIITFGKNIANSDISYMQFKDMLNRVHFKRLNLYKRTKLTKPLLFNDVEIEVVDASHFDIPNPTLRKPSIIEINGERIEFYSLVGNKLGKLRRGTLGTGTPYVHLINSTVQEIGPSETMPYSDNADIEKIVYTGSLIIPLTYTPASSGVTSWFKNIGYTYKEDFSSTASYVLKDVVIYNNNYYVNVKSFIPKSTIITDPTNPTYWTLYETSIPVGYGLCNEIEVFVGGYNDSSSWIAGFDYVIGSIVTIGTYTYKCVSDHTSSDSFKADITNWAFFVGNLRLKKLPYKIHTEINAPYSPEGDVILDAEFSVDGVSKSIRLTHPLTTGTYITVVKRTGNDWDSTTNVQFDKGKIGTFLKSAPAVWYQDTKRLTNDNTINSTWDSANLTFDSLNTTFDQG